jgi:endonuclease III
LTAARTESQCRSPHAVKDAAKAFMKNSKEYSQKVRKLYRSLKRKYTKTGSVTYEDPVDALICAVVSEKMIGPEADSAMKRFADYFVDFNDLRVSRAEEVVEVLGADTPDTRDIASALTRALRSVFEKYHTVSLAALKKVGKKPARRVLEKMDGVSPFVVDYCMLTSLHGHAIPLTERMIDCLKREQLVHPDADEQQMRGFLTRQIPADNAYEFYYLLRRRSESRRAGRKKKAVRNTQTAASTRTRKRTKETTGKKTKN